MVHQISDTSKTVQTEATRLTTMVLRLQHIKKSIDSGRAEHLLRRISAQFLTYDQDQAMTNLEKVEVIITCPDCHGSGVRRIVNGADAGTYFVAMDDEYVPCHCDHDGAQDIEIGG